MTRTFGRPAGYAAVGLCLGLVLAAFFGAFAVIGQIRSTQVDNTQRNKDAATTLAIIQDCSQPSGRCYERAQRQTARTLASAQQIVVLAAACAVDVSNVQTVDQRVDAITACISRRLADRQP